MTIQAWTGQKSLRFAFFLFRRGGTSFNSYSFWACSIKNYREKLHVRMNTSIVILTVISVC